MTIYIHTSKTRRHRPNGKIVRLDEPGGDGTRIADERSAETLHRRHPGVYSEPAEIPCSANRKPDKEVGF